MVCVSIGSLMICVGGMSVTVPREVTLPRPASTWPRGPLGSGAAELEHGAADHRRAGQHVLLGHLLHEAVGRDDGDVAGLHVGLVDDAAHAAVVVDVAVGVDHRRHRPACRGAAQ